MIFSPKCIRCFYNSYNGILLISLCANLYIFSTYFTAQHQNGKQKLQNGDGLEVIQNNSIFSENDITSLYDNVKQVNKSEKFTKKKSLLKKKKVFKLKKSKPTGLKNAPSKIKSFEHLEAKRKKAVAAARTSIQKEMTNYEFQANETLKSLVLESGGKPIRNIISTTWRSGSTFLGAAVASHPATFYHYEPLLHFGIKQVRSGSLGREGLRVIRNQLSCKFNELKDYMKNGEREYWTFSHNERVWKYCAKEMQTCFDAEFMSRMCSLFPFQSLKTVRLRLRVAKELLESSEFDVRLLLLVRDPRGTMQSRSHRDWCPDDPDCYDPSRLCMDMEDDFAEAEILREKYPERFLAIRYEDLSLNPYEAIRKIFKFFRLQFHPKVEQFLNKHTKSNSGGVSSTFRDSKSAPFHWREDFAGNFSEVLSIQESCGLAMKVWGYNPVENNKDLLKFNPISEAPWPEMKIEEVGRNILKNGENDEVTENKID